MKQAKKDMDDYELNEQYEQASRAQYIHGELDDIFDRIQTIGNDDVTDEKYQLEEKKRKLAQQLDALGKDQRIVGIIEEYFEEKSDCEYVLEEAKDAVRKQKFEKIVAKEREYLASQSSYTIKAKIEELRQLSWEIRRNQNEVWINLFYYYSTQPIQDYKDQKKAKQFIEIGEKALDRKNYDELKVATNNLYNLLPDSKRDEARIKGTGIG
jgi:molecular chaperone DnaK